MLKPKPEQKSNLYIFSCVSLGSRCVLAELVRDRLLSLQPCPHPLLQGVLRSSLPGRLCLRVRPKREKSFFKFLLSHKQEGKVELRSDWEAFALCRCNILGRERVHTGNHRDDKLLFSHREEPRLVLDFYSVDVVDSRPNGLIHRIFFFFFFF